MSAPCIANIKLEKYIEKSKDSILTSLKNSELVPVEKLELWSSKKLNNAGI